MSEAKITLTAVDKTKAAIQSAKDNLGQLQTHAVAVSGVLAGLGVTAWAAGLVAGIRSTLNEWDELSKAAQRAGFSSSQSFAEFEYAAKLAGVGVQGLETAVGKLSQKMADAAGGSKEAGALFESIGVKVKTATGELRATEDVLTDVAAKFSSWKDGPEKSALAMELFGKSGKELIPLLNGGAAGLETLRGEFRALRGELTDQTAKAAEQFNDNLTRLETAAGSLKRTLADKLLDGLVQITDAMVEQAKKGSALLAVWAGLAEFGKITFNLDDKGKAITAQKNAAGELEVLMGRFELLQKIMEREPGNDAARQEMVKLRAEIEAVQKKALDATHAVKSLLNPGYENDPSLQRLEDRRLQGLNAPIVPKGSGSGSEVSEYQRLNAELQKRAELERAELEWGGKLSEARKFEVEMLAKIEAGTAKLSVTEKARLEGRVKDISRSIEANAAMERQTKLALELGKAWEEEERAIREFAKKQEQREKDQLNWAREKIEQIQFETSLIGMNNDQREQAIALRELEKQGIKEGTLAWETYAAAIKEAVGNRAAVQRSAEEFKGTWELVDGVARDVWTNIEQGGAGTFRRLADTLKSTLLAMLYKMTVQPWLLNIVANVTGTPLSTAQALTGITGSSGLSGLTGLGNIGSVGNLFGLGGSLASASYAAAVPGLTSFGAGSQAAMLAAQTGEFGLAGLSATAASAGGSALGSIAGALGSIPGWGWAALAAAAIFGLSGKGETRVGGQYLNGNFLGGPSGGQINGAAEALTATMASINGALRTLGSKDTLGDFFGALEQSKNGKGFAAAGGTLSSGMSFGQGQGSEWSMNRRGSMTAEQALAAYQAELQQATLQAIQAATDIPHSIADKLAGLDIDALGDAEVKALYDQITGTVAGVAQFRQAVQALPFQSLAALSFDAAAGVVSLAGGIDKLQAGLQSYYDGFFTDAEKRANTIRQITATLNAAGLQVTETQVGTATAQQIRRVVDSLDLTTESGQRLFGVLMSVSGAMGSLINSVQQQRDGLETQILQLQGNTAALRARELAAITDDYNRGLQLQIYALTDAKAAAEAAGATAAVSGSLADGAARAAADAAAATGKAARDQLEAQRQVLQETQSNLKSVFELLRTSVRDLYGEVGGLTLSAARGRAFIQRALGAARQGYFPQQDDLAAAISAARGGLTTDNYGSQLEMDRARVQLAAQLSELQDLTGEQLTTTEKQLKAAEDQLAAMEQVAQNSSEMRDSLQAIAGTSATTAQYLAALGDAVQSAIAAGLNPGTKNIATLAGSTPNTWNGNYYASAAGAGLVKTTSGTQIAAISGQLYSQQQVVDFANAQIASGNIRGLYDRLRTEGISLATFDELMDQPADWSEAAARAMGWPVFDVGTNRVLRDGPAWLHKDEAVVPKAYNPAVNARAATGSSTDAGSLRELRAEVAGLRADQRAQASAYLKLQDKVLTLMERWEVVGLPETRTI